jgi:hypothetical protein
MLRIHRAYTNRLKGGNVEGPSGTGNAGGADWKLKPFTESVVVSLVELESWKVGGLGGSDKDWVNGVEGSG